MLLRWYNLHHLRYFFARELWPMDISIVITKMIMLVLIMLIGYIACKTGITGPEANKYLSSLLINVFLVFSILQGTINIDPALSTGEILLMFLYFVMAFGIYWLVGWLYVKIFHVQKDRGITILLVVFINTVFLAFPIIQSIYGSEAIFYASLSNIPFNVLLFSVGIAQLSDDGMASFSPKKMFNPPMFAILISILLFIFHPTVPAILEDTIRTAAGGTVPLSMLIIGTSLGSISFREIFSDWRPYVISALRLIICPLVCAAVFKGLIHREMMFGILLIIASCPPAVMLTPICIQYGQDESLASKTICIATILSTITIPLMLWIVT